jgi:hypothetical protein
VRPSSEASGVWTMARATAAAEALATPAVTAVSPRWIRPRSRSASATSRLAHCDAPLKESSRTVSAAR